MTQHLAAEYKASSFCSGGDCVEVGMRHGGVVAVRDTKDRGRELRFSSQEWAAFVAGIKHSAFDAIWPRLPCDQCRLRSRRRWPSRSLPA
jgi:Domain of unknown function (DUF397)